MTTDEKTSETPIIDIHTHIFSAMDIPIAGYLSSRRMDTSSKGIIKMIRVVLMFILTEVLGTTVLYPFLANAIREKWARNKLEKRETTGLIQFGLSVARRMLPKNRRDRASSLSQTTVREDWARSQLKDQRAMKRRKQTRYDVAIWAISKAEGKTYGEWARVLSQDVEKIAREMVKVYDETKVDLYVPLMVDYEYWFKDSSDTPLERQIDYIYEHVILEHKGKIHPFVPFDPARELVSDNNMHNPDGEHEKGSLHLVKDAIENKGFIGVKVYNTLGYAPYYNAAVEQYRNLAATVNEQTKYLFKGEEYDRVLGELYVYCIENNVPITAHCQMGGIEAYPDASFDFCRPELWRQCLNASVPRKKDGKRIALAKLRLNLGHFGWNQAQGFSVSEGNWVRQICDMMLQYDHVFADVSHHDVIPGAGRKNIKKSYQRMREYYDDDADLDKIKSRLLFGTDWHVLTRVPEYGTFQRCYVEVLEHDGFCDAAEIQRFLGGNALDFLGFRLPGDKNNRTRLERFYKKHNIEPPAWFKSLS